MHLGYKALGRYYTDYSANGVICAQLPSHGRVQRRQKQGEEPSRVRRRVCDCYYYNRSPKDVFPIALSGQHPLDRWSVHLRWKDFCSHILYPDREDVD